MKQFVMTLDAECKRRAPDPTALYEMSFCIRDTQSQSARPLVWRKFKFFTDGDYAPGVLDWQRKEGLEEHFRRQEEVNRHVDNAQVVATMREWLAEQVVKYPSFTTVGYPIAFDWQFLNFYLYHYGGVKSDNPLGYKGDDLDSLGRGLWGGAWDDQMEEQIAARARYQTLLIDYCENLQAHDSLFDATVQSLMVQEVAQALRDRHQPEPPGEQEKITESYCQIL